MKKGRFLQGIFIISLLISVTGLLVTGNSYIKTNKALTTAEEKTSFYILYKKINKDKILFSLSILLLLCILSSFIIIKNFKSPTNWLILSCFISFFLLGEIFFVWHLALFKDLEPSHKHAPILCKKEISAFLNKIDTTRQFTAIPTGIFIENISFTRSDNIIRRGVLLTGYIWQIYNPTIPTDIAREFFFPDAVNYTINKIYHEKDQAGERICWWFFAMLKQKFNFIDYPFDHKHIIVLLLHKDFQKNVILIPNLASYHTIEPEKMPGIAQNISILHWNIHKSFFTYNIFNYATDLGIPNFAYTQSPQLNFYIITQRKILGPFLTYLLLLLITAIILYGALLACHKKRGVSSLLGFNTLSILGVCSGLLFVLLTSQISLRNTLGLDNITYIEYLYFIIYCMLILVAINSILFTLKEIKMIQYQNNLLPKLLYWPVLLVATLCITVLKFY